MSQQRPVLGAILLFYWLTDRVIITYNTNMCLYTCIYIVSTHMYTIYICIYTYIVLLLKWCSQVRHFYFLFLLSNIIVSCHDPLIESEDTEKHTPLIRYWTMCKWSKIKGAPGCLWSCSWVMTSWNSFVHFQGFLSLEEIYMY